ncbi:bZIP transcription factor 44 [Orobanche gracilis]
MESSSGSDGNLQQAVDQRKRKRMQSNRESARRSRMRKQQHLDDLTAEVARMTRENNQVSTTINVTKQHFASVEAENSVLRAQMMELSQRLKSLNEILDYMNSSSDTSAAGGCTFEADEFQHQVFGDGFSYNPWPVVASAGVVFDYY